MRTASLVILLATALAACAGPGRAAPQQHDLRIVSYNIRHGRGMDGRVDLARTADALRALAPDLIALQEVDQNVARSGVVDQAAELGRALGMQHAFGSFLDLQGGRYGMAILSRLPIRAQRVLELPPGNEPRIALLVEVETPGGAAVSLVGVHFNWVADDTLRYAQAQTLCTYLDALTTPYVVVGDFNDLPGSRTLALFDARATPATKPDGARDTYPADAPKKEIDFVYAAPRERWRIGEVRVVDERMASDHRPVLAVLGIGAPGRAP